MTDPGRPKTLSEVPPITDQALAFARSQARDKVGIFRHKSGRAMVYSAIGLFLLSSFSPLLDYFAPDFHANAWTLTKWLFFAGIAFAGPEVVEGFVRLFQGSKEGH